MVPFDHAEHLAWEVVGAPLFSDSGSRPKERNKNTLDRGELIIRLFKEAHDWIDTDQASLAVEHIVSDPVVKGPVNRTKIGQMMEYAMNELSDKLDA